MRDNGDHWRAPLERQIDRLVGTGCLIETHDRSTVTAFGLAVARSGLKPETASYFIQRLVQHCEALRELLPRSANTGDRYRVPAVRRSAMFKEACRATVQAPRCVADHVMPI
jgi:hypothetical protein